MLCKICNIKEATEQYSPKGRRLKQKEYCRECLEREIRNPSDCEGSMPREEKLTRTLSRRGTESVGRKCISSQVLGGQAERNEFDPND
jgi:hypothetical protein